MEGAFGGGQWILSGSVLIACLVMAVLPADAAPRDLPVLYVNATGPLTPLDHALLPEPWIPGGSAEAIHNAPARVALGDTVVQWLVTHGDGRQELYRQVITTRDVDPPWFVDGQDAYVVGRTGKLTDANFGVPTAVDAVDLDVDVSSSHEPGSGFRVGNTTVEFTATDDSGNSAVHEMVVIVSDPRIRNLVLDVTPDRIRATWDPLPDGPQYKASISERGGERVETAKMRETVHIFYNLDAGTEYVVAVGAAGERDTTSRKTATTPMSGPREATIPDDIVYEATAPLTQVYLGEVDVLGWDTAPSISNDAPAAFPLGETTVTWTVTDGEASITGEQLVTVTDTTKPVFSNLPESGTYIGNYYWARVSFDMPTATDVADPEVEVTRSRAWSTLYPIGNTTITFTAKDDSGNIAQHDIVITVHYPTTFEPILYQFEDMENWAFPIYEYPPKEIPRYYGFGYPIDKEVGNPKPSALINVTGLGTIFSTDIDISGLKDGEDLYISADVMHSSNIIYDASGNIISIEYYPVSMSAAVFIHELYGRVIFDDYAYSTFDKIWSTVGSNIGNKLEGDIVLVITFRAYDSHNIRYKDNVQNSIHIDNLYIGTKPFIRPANSSDGHTNSQPDQWTPYFTIDRQSNRTHVWDMNHIPPSMSIKGNIEIDRPLNRFYSDPGATCVQGYSKWSADADVSMVDWRKAGQYPVTYTCTSSGVTFVAYRIVNIVDTGVRW